MINKRPTTDTPGASTCQTAAIDASRDISCLVDTPAACNVRSSLKTAGSIGKRRTKTERGRPANAATGALPRQLRPSTPSDSNDASSPSGPILNESPGGGRPSAGRLFSIRAPSPTVRGAYSSATILCHPSDVTGFARGGAESSVPDSGSDGDKPSRVGVGSTSKAKKEV